MKPDTMSVTDDRKLYTVEIHMYDKLLSFVSLDCFHDNEFLFSAFIEKFWFDLFHRLFMKDRVIIYPSEYKHIIQLPFATESKIEIVRFYKRSKYIEYRIYGTYMYEILDKSRWKIFTNTFGHIFKFNIDAYGLIAIRTLEQQLISIDDMEQYKNMSRENILYDLFLKYATSS